MTFQQTPFTVLLLFSGGFSSLLAIYVIARTRNSYAVPSAVPFAVVPVAGAIWSVAYALQLASTDLAGKVFWSRFVWLGAATIPTAWFIFLLAYTGRESWLSKWTVGALALEPIAIIALVWTNDRHRLFVQEVHLIEEGSFTTMAATIGPLFTAHLAYSYLLAVIGFGMLVVFFWSSDDMLRRQAIALLVGAIVPWLANVITLTGSSPFQNIDLTPFSFTVGLAVTGWALIQYDLLDVVPVALGTVMDTIPDGIVVLDAQDRVVYCNDTVKSAFIDDESPIGSPAGTVFEAYPTLVSLLSSGQPEPEVLTVDDGDSRQFFEVRIVDAIDPRLPGRLLFLRDVTESQIIERRFQTLIERSSGLITILDPDGTRRYVSPSVEHVLGYDPESITSEDAFELVHPDDRDEVRKAFEQVVAGDTVRTAYRVRHRDGSWRSFEEVGTNLIDDPTVEGVVFNLRDVTDRRHYEQRLQVLNRVLRHDLRNDVTVIHGYTKLLAEAVADPEAASWAGVIEEKCDEMVGLSEKAGQIDYMLHREADGLESIDVVAHLEEAISTVRRHHDDVEIEFEHNGPQWVYADSLMDSAIDNLLENAVAHNDRQRPKIRASVSEIRDEDEEFVEVEITDDGPGIEPAEQSVLDTGVETPLHHASGLGLWLVNWIVEQSDGQLEISDNEPRGSVVTMQLRAAEPPGA